MVERRLAEELGAALVFQDQQLALHRADGGGGDVAVLGADLLGVLGQVGQKLAQILKVDETVRIGVAQLRIVVGELEGDVDHAFLDVVEIEHARQQQRPHLEHAWCGSDGPARRTGPRTPREIRRAGT